MPGNAQADAPPSCLLALPEILDLKAAAPLAAGFLAVRGRPVHVDAAQVNWVGGLCLQVLLSAAKTWQLDEACFSLVNPSSEFIAGLARLGIAIADFPCQDKNQ